jgi:TolB-like protein/cytochrome c-type biogenesis protein CcmH/NrfG
MLSGTPTFADKTVADTLARVIDGNPDWTALPSATPASVRRLLSRALVKDLRGRLNDIGDARLEIEGADAADGSVKPADSRVDSRAPRATTRFGIQAGALVATVVILGVAAWYLMVGRARGAPPNPIRSIAVLPLQNLSGNPDDEFFADGATESLMSSLVQLHAVDVISRTSAMRYKGTTKPMQQIAQELGVDAVVEGAVQRIDGRVRISAQLIRAATDTHVWAKEYDREARDFLQLESDIARAIVDEIRPRIATGATGVARTVSPDAQEAYLLGRHHYWKNSEPELRKAVEYFDRATQLEPDYAEAYAGSSLAWAVLRDFGDPRSGSEGRRAAARALEINPKLALGYAALGNVLLKEWQWAEAEQAFRRALEIDPDQLDACGCYSIFLGWRGRIEEALATIEHARKLDPLSTTTEWQYGVILYFARRYDDSVAHLRRAIELDPRNVPAYRTLVRTYEEAGRVQDALPILDRPQFRDGYEFGIAYVMQGRRDDALRILQHVEARGDSVGAATLSLWLHDDDRAFRWLRRALDDKRPNVTNLKVAPVFDRVRSDPRFAELVQRLNLPD